MKIFVFCMNACVAFNMQWLTDLILLEENILINPNCIGGGADLPQVFLLLKI